MPQNLRPEDIELVVNGLRALEDDLSKSIKLIVPDGRVTTNLVARLREMREHAQRLREVFSGAKQVNIDNSIDTQS